MNIGERIARRQTSAGSGAFLVDRDALSPASHLPEPVNRGPELERLLDALDPAFDGSLPPDVAVYGPPGSGKSALVEALFDQLTASVAQSTTAIQTATRASSTAAPSWFVYLDCRGLSSDFRFYHTLLDGVTDESVPSRGIGTQTLVDRLVDTFRQPTAGAVLAVDHVDEPGAISLAEVRELLEPVRDDVTLVTVGRHEPEDWSSLTVDIGPYQRHSLVDVLTERTSRGLTRAAVDHDQIREVAVWAEGNAHDALAALLGASILAAADGSDRLHDDHVDAGIAAVPADSVHVGRVLALPENHQRVLAGLLDLEADSLAIDDAADAIADASSLSPSTIKRFLYELAEDGILERVRIEDDGQGGRQPSRVAPRFPTLAFEGLSDVASDGG